MEVKDFSLSIKAIEDSGEFRAVAAAYGVRDLQDDVIEAGAFRKAINEQGDGFPLLWAHDQARPIGLAKLEDSAKGPIVLGAIDKSDPDGSVAYKRVKSGMVRGVSIGFTLPNVDGVKYADGVRYIRELRLHEISVVSVPAQPAAQIIAVKQLGDAMRLMKTFDPAQLAPADLALLLSIDAELKRLIPKNGISVAMLSELSAFANELQARH